MLLTEEGYKENKPARLFKARDLKESVVEDRGGHITSSLYTAHLSPDELHCSSPKSRFWHYPARQAMDRRAAGVLVKERVKIGLVCNTNPGNRVPTPGFLQGISLQECLSDALSGLSTAGIIDRFRRH
jgi:hypothetical protein